MWYSLKLPPLIAASLLIFSSTSKLSYSVLSTFSRSISNTLYSVTVSTEGSSASGATVLIASSPSTTSALLSASSGRSLSSVGEIVTESISTASGYDTAASIPVCSAEGSSAGSSYGRSSVTVIVPVCPSLITKYRSADSK